MVVRELTGERTFGLRRAREELDLDLGEIELAVQFGEVRTAAGENGRRVPREEVDRLRAEDGFPEALRERLRLVGTAGGAELIGISRDRFTKLAKCGCLIPARWYVNRYRAVVWLYLAREVREFGELNKDWLTGRLPAGLRGCLDSGADWRARGWRTRRAGQLCAEAADDWEQAAVWAALLGQEEAADIVPDPFERAYLRKLMPGLPPGRIGSYAAGDVVAALALADSAEEIESARISLAHALTRARAERPAPHPAEAAVSAAASPMWPEAAADEPRRSWLRALLRRG